MMITKVQNLNLAMMTMTRRISVQLDCSAEFFFLGQREGRYSILFYSVLCKKLFCATLALSQKNGKNLVSTTDPQENKKLALTNIAMGFLNIYDILLKSTMTELGENDRLREHTQECGGPTVNKRELANIR